MAGEPFEKWWSEKPVSLRLGAVHGSAGDTAEEAWTASRLRAIEACAAAAVEEARACKAVADSLPSGDPDRTLNLGGALALHTLAARLRRLNARDEA